MWLSWVSREVGTLMCGIGMSGQVLFSIELPNDPSVVEVVIMCRCIFMVAQQLAGGCQY